MDLEWLSKRSWQLKRYEPYSIYEQIRRRGLNVSDIIKLDANENIFMPKAYMRTLFSKVSETIDVRLYPSDDKKILEEALSSYLNIPPQQIVLGAGGDQIIELVLYSVLREGEKVLAITPTFSMYKRTAAIRGVNYIGIDTNEDFTINYDELISKFNEKPRLLIICNPNNPTSNQFKYRTVLDIIEEFPGVVLVDEAYSEFGEYTLLKKINDYKNLIILKTFSKAFGLAGMRLGYAVTNKNLSTILKKNQSPYPISTISLKMGIGVLENISMVKKIVEEIKKNRIKLIKELNNINGVKAFPSSTNFVLFNLQKNFSEVHESLLDSGVLVRKIGPVPGHQNCLRVTVAPWNLMTGFLYALKGVLV